jgi:hypothetical protein
MDSFAAISTLFGRETFAGAVRLGDVWSSIPSVAGLLPSELRAGANRPIWLVPKNPTERAAPYPHLAVWSHIDITAVDDDASDLTDRLVEHYLPSGAPYPRLYAPQGIAPQYEQTPLGLGVRVSFQAAHASLAGHRRTLSEISTDAAGFEPFALMPSLGGGHLSLLARWWLVLYGMSMVARYEPGRWMDALDLGGATTAAAIEELLNVALDEIPNVLWKELSRMNSMAPVEFSEEND